MDILFTSDDGHGWYRVPLSALNGFEPSHYSYKDCYYAYLEQDCDFERWLNHNSIDFKSINFLTHLTYGVSYVRQKARFIERKK